jgi:hypothetical protein
VAQLTDLPLQLGYPLRILARRARPLPRIDLRLTDPTTQRLPVDTQLGRDRRDRSLTTPRLPLDLDHHPHGPIPQLVRVLPRCWHDSHLCRLRSLQKTRGGSLLLDISLDRLRKTYLEQHRKPVAHTPATLAAYLRQMRTVTDDGFQIVREALDEQVAAALARRRLTVDPCGEHQDNEPERDTVLATCRDFTSTFALSL